MTNIEQELKGELAICKRMVVKLTDQCCELELQISQAKAEERERMLRGVKSFRNKPTMYHYTCWASSTVLIVNSWGRGKMFECPHYNGDFNCGFRACSRKNIKGDLALTQNETVENYLIDKIIEALQGLP